MSELNTGKRLQASEFVFDEEGPIFKECSIATIKKYKNKTPMIIHRGGHVSVVLKFKGVDCSPFTFERFQSFLGSWKSALNICNEDLSLSVTTVNRSATKKNLKPQHPLLKARVDHFNSMNLKQSDFYITLFYRNRKTKAAANTFSLKNLFAGIGKIKKSLSESDFEGLMDRAEYIETKLVELGSLLASLQIPYDLISSEEEYTSLFRHFYAGESAGAKVTLKESSSNTYRKNILEGCSVGTYPTHFELNGDVYLLFVADVMPENREVYGGEIGVFLNMPFEYIYTVSSNKYSLEDTDTKLKRSIKKQAEDLDGDDVTGADRDLIKDERYRTSQEALMEWSKNPTPVCDVTISMFVKIPRMQILDEMAREKSSKEKIIAKKEHDIINNYLNRFVGSVWKTEGESSWFVFNKSIPGLCHATAVEHKKFLMRQEEVAYIHGIWATGDTERHNGFNHLIDDFGSIYPFSPFDGKENYNGLISGGSGSGKSVLMDTIIGMAQGGAYGDVPPKIRIIDNSGENGSYYALAKLFNGTVINFSGSERPILPLMDVEPTMCIPTSKKQAQLVNWLKDNGVKTNEKTPSAITSFFLWIIKEGLVNITDGQFNDKFVETFGIPAPSTARNSFTLKPGECKPFQRTLSFIVGLLDIIFTSSGKKYQSSIIEGFVSELFERTTGRMPTMTDLHAFLVDILDEDDEDNRNLIMTVKNWTGSGAFPYFEGECTVNLDADIVVVDMKGIESEETLAAVYMLLFNERFSRDLYFTRGRAKYIIRDEIWRLIRSAIAASYMEEDVKTARKNTISTWFILQQIPELMDKNPTLIQALLDNSEFIFIGSISSGPTKERLRQILEIPPQVYEQAFREEITLGKNEDKDHR
ncbi:TraG/VirB4 family ATPase, partial [Bdellovibrio sp. BCCA]|uniref:TraG/VirB4 family ATPase n=1 Tax=Bdellovibrio sp. BCCA TaxID=3136281 RepID=UPI0030F30602